MIDIFSRNNLLLLLVALLWGLGFAPQRLALDGMAPLAFNFWRFAFGALVLVPFICFSKEAKRSLTNSKTLIAGIGLGVLLTLGAAFQQMALAYTKVANVAFITGFYVALVPIIAIFFKKTYPLLTWLGGLIAFVGLSLLSGFDGEFNYLGDGLALTGAIFWALHLWAISFWVGRHNLFTLAFIQFFVCALLSLIYSVFFESGPWASQFSAYAWALCSGVFVVGLAYTLQVYALKEADPFIAAIIFSTESVFGALVGYWVFDELLGALGILGALLMLIGFVLAQSHERSRN
jgi:drug/metabolite transporter (DMT)-like permease